MISYNCNDIYLRIREVLEGKGIKESRQGGYIYAKLKGTEAEVSRATVARWLRGEGVPQQKHFQIIFKRWELTNSEVIYLLTGVKHESPENTPEYHDYFLTMKVFSKMHECLIKDNARYEMELSEDRIRTIFKTIMNIASLTDGKVIDDKIVQTICTN